MNAWWIWLLLLAAADGQQQPTVHVGSKAFTESAILGELVTQLGRDAGVPVVHHEQLGGTGLVYNALVAGDLDIYPDYTGTIAKDILADDSLRSLDDIRAALAEVGIVMSRPLGFENSYALGMSERRAAELGVRKISDLKRHPEFRYGFSAEFVDRADGWPGLRRHYQLEAAQVRGLEHAVAYRAIGSGDIDVMDIYTTDANVAEFDLRVLEDDRGYFPKYEAVLLYRADLVERVSAMAGVIRNLEGAVEREDMLAMNVAVDVRGATPKGAANQFVARRFDVQVDSGEVTLLERVAQRTWEHLWLVVISLSAAIGVAVPLGVVAAKRPATEPIILAGAEVIQTIPGLALLVLLLKPLEIVGLQTVGAVPAIIALFLYSLLPVIRNTYTGIHDIPRPIRESAVALGLTPWAQLMRIELPMASRLILAGIKTTAVINVGYAVLGGLIGAGGYGQPILQGLYRNNLPKMLEGAVPAAILALLVKWLWQAAERFLVPRGLRLG